MPIRNMWSLQPGECLTAEKLAKIGEVFFPLRDVGVDLLVVKGDKHVKLQVKESRYYHPMKWKSGHIGHSWHQIQKGKLLKDDVDFYVFLTYKEDFGKHKIRGFENKFLIVPKEELKKKIKFKDAGKKNVYSFYFHFENEKVWDERVKNGPTDYSKFLGAWKLVEDALNS